MATDRPDPLGDFLRLRERAGEASRDAERAAGRLGRLLEEAAALGCPDRTALEARLAELRAREADLEKELAAGVAELERKWGKHEGGDLGIRHSR